MDADQSDAVSSEAAGGVDVTIDYDRDDGGPIVDSLVKALRTEGYELRYKRIR